MNLRKKQQKLAADHRAVKYNFILTELELALTFCEMAVTSSDQAKSKRNAENARRAYDSATHFLEDDSFSGTMNANVRRKLAKLKNRLKELSGRTVRTC